MENAQAILIDLPEPLVEAPVSDELAAPAPETAQLKQERRQLAVRDINAKIDDLEKTMSGLTAAFGQSQEAVSGSLRELQRRSTQVATDIVGVATRMERASRHQEEANQALETRLKGSMAQLREQLGKTGTALEIQQSRIDQLESGQQALQTLHDALAADGRRQTAELKALTVETREQLQINRTHIEGLNALHREQKHALQGLAGDVDLLSERTNYLADQITSLQIDVAQDRRHTFKRFRTVAWSMGALAVVVFAVMAVLHYHPTTIPVAVKQQIATLTATVDQQAAAQHTLDADVQGIEGQLGALGARVEKQGTQIAAMQTAIDHSTALLQRLQKSEAAVSRRVAGLEATSYTIAPGSLRDNSWLASLPAEHFSIQLLGSSDSSYLRDFASVHAAQLEGGTVALASSSSHGGEWYSLFYGDFATRADAVAALKSLPESLQRNQPLVRSLGSIQGALR
jgi:chromosome segregation ATPase